MGTLSLLTMLAASLTSSSSIMLMAALIFHFIFSITTPLSAFKKNPSVSYLFSRSFITQSTLIIFCHSTPSDLLGYATIF